MYGIFKKRQYFGPRLETISDLKKSIASYFQKMPAIHMYKYMYSICIIYLGIFCPFFGGRLPKLESSPVQSHSYYYKQPLFHWWIPDIVIEVFNHTMNMSFTDIQKPTSPVTD